MRNLMRLLALLCSALTFLAVSGDQHAFAQELSLEQRQPLELVFADSIVPQDRHELMLTTGIWLFRHGDLRHQSLTQKVEWGLSDRLQISTFAHLFERSNETGQNETGVGDIEIGGRYTWPTVASPFTHIAVAIDAGFPTGDPLRGIGEGAYTVSPSLLFSHEFQAGKYQFFSTNGAEFVTAHRQVGGDAPHHTFFSNSGLAMRLGHGWAVGELSVNTNEWSGEGDTQVALSPAYVWRLARRTELLLGVPVGLTSSTDRVGAVIKFTFELGGGAE
jgi:hypothetical protein